VRNEVKRWAELGERSGRSTVGRSRGLRKGSAIPRRLSQWKAKRSRSGSPKGQRGPGRSSPFIPSMIFREALKFRGPANSSFRVKDLIADGSTEGALPSRLGKGPTSLTRSDEG
jgi:hypothetical protein